MAEEKEKANDDGGFRPGDVVETNYGVGVISSTIFSTDDGTTSDNKCDSVAEGKFQVLLWRVPGRSLGSCTVAYLQPKMILGKLPAAPGMITTMSGSKERVLVKCYNSSTKQFLVSSISDDNEKNKGTEEEEKSDDSDDDVEDEIAQLERLSMSRSSIHAQKEDMAAITKAAARSPTEALCFEAAVKDLDLAPSAKFYPLLHDLMKRGDQQAAALSSIFDNDATRKIVGKTTKLVQSSREKVVATVAGGTTKINADDTIDKISTTVQANVPTDQQLKHVISMLKDEELTVLLEKGKERLQQLVSSEIPEATRVALKQSGIKIKSASEDAAAAGDKENDNAGDSAHEDITNTIKLSISESLTVSRRKALETIDEILQKAELDKADLQQFHEHLGGQFSVMFDSLSQAARSDRTLGGIFDTISSKTTEWQQATGKLLATKSASLFMEGASRIQARAAGIFSQDQLQWAGENIGSKLTKAFTEGDAAVARLKSIQLGNAVRNRLVEAIEIRSESVGGLDGIIAGALSTLKQKGHESTFQIQGLLSNLQMSASSATIDTNETLISVLSRRSAFRDVALLQLEQTLCDLENTFGGDFIPADAESIASLARGEGGTAKIFEPIANRAAKEIQKQLDVAEASAVASDNPAILQVLQRVRKIVSGELTVNALLDEVVNVLNDEKVVAAGEMIVKHGEHVLDAIEGVSGNQVVSDVMQTMEKAGITKDAVMKNFENLDMNRLLEDAEGAVTDENKRKKMLSSATDLALDFFLRILPSMPVPPFDGAKDGLVYHFSNLSMQGFKVKKENITVEIAGMRATKKRRKSSKNTADQQVDNKDNDSGVKDEEDKTAGQDQEEVDEDDSTSSSEHGDVLRTRSSTGGSQDFVDVLESSKPAGVKATELLIIDIKNISAAFNDAVWSFEQTYMPYLKGNGKANVMMSDGSIRIQFELRKRRKATSSSTPTIEQQEVDTSEEKEDNDTEWEPVLCLHDRTCSIGEVNLTLQGEGRLTWIINKLAAVFKGPLRDYVVRTIVAVLTDKSGWILEKLNDILSPYWDMIMKTAQLNMDELLEADDDVVVAAKPSKSDREIELVWKEQLPLGLNLLLNDASGLLKVVDFPRGSQARSVCEKRNLEPALFKGATIVGVNGCRYQDQDELFDALKDPSRPKTVMFELADTDEINRIMQFVAGEFESNEGESEKKKNSDKDANPEGRRLEKRIVNFTEPGQLGIEFGESIDHFGLVVVNFIEGDAGTILAAERTGQVLIGDLLTHINGECVLGDNGVGRSKAMELLESVGMKRPLSLTFVDHYLYDVVFKNPSGSIVSVIGGPDELNLAVKQFPDGSKRIVVEGFEEVSGAAENNGILLGDHLAFVNGNPVGAGCRWTEVLPAPSLSDVYGMLRDEMNYPIGLTFARPKQTSTESRWGSWGAKSDLRDDEAQTICVSAERLDVLGCVFDSSGQNDIIVTDFVAVPGIFQQVLMKCLKNKKSDNSAPPLAIESVNNQFVPSYASTDMIKNVLKRGWTSKEGQVEVLFCDYEKKTWVHSLVNESPSDTTDVTAS